MCSKKKEDKKFANDMKIIMFLLFQLLKRE